MYVPTDGEVRGSRAGAGEPAAAGADPDAVAQSYWHRVDAGDGHPLQLVAATGRPIEQQLASCRATAVDSFADWHCVSAKQGEESRVKERFSPSRSCPRSASHVRAALFCLAVAFSVMPAAAPPRGFGAVHSSTGIAAESDGAASAHVVTVLPPSPVPIADLGLRVPVWQTRSKSKWLASNTSLQSWRSFGRKGRAGVQLAGDDGGTRYFLGSCPTTAPPCPHREPCILASPACHAAGCCARTATKSGPCMRQNMANADRL
ncbi:hypothetical protein HU200_006570 [Digitaria exilis]|uniref:Uncharacterized protein n=1 Tax=Digitaria exilis TaxID=1010633 RepID=A0A835FPW3_9POAL|nr:hypothetical protein HU200_006570 [Digitaria exilis]